MSESILVKLRETVEKSRLRDFPTFERKRELSESPMPKIV
jgi:hypothetical protein